uniref:Uncharacterized protein n=1 Tax=Davidia involucrata TaxID=16924 RepID=A0A5B7CHD4_DAVIN
MVFHKSLFTNLFILSILFSSITLQLATAMRPLEGERWLKTRFPLLESLPKGPVTPSGSSPCSNIPGGTGTCTLNGKNFAGHVVHSPPVYPGAVIKFAAASMASDTNKNDPIS